MKKLRLGFLVAMMIIGTLMMTGCADMQLGLTFNKDGTITQNNSIEVQPNVRQYWNVDGDINKQKQDDIKDGFLITNKANGYTATKTYKNAEELAGLKIMQPNQEGKTNGLQLKRGFLYDYYSVNIFFKGQKNDMPTSNYQADIPDYFSSNMNVFDYLDYRRQAEEDARQINQMMNQAMKTLIDSAKLNFTINIPYTVDSANADIQSNDGKTLTWDLKPAFLENKDTTVHADFRIYHEKNIIALLAIGGFMFIIAIVCLVLGIIKRNDKTVAPIYFGATVIIMAILIGSAIYTNYTIKHPPVLTEYDIVAQTNSANTTSSDTSVKTSDNKTSVNDADLQRANDVIKSKNLNYKLTAVSKFDDDGFFGVATGKGVAYVIYDKKDDVIATVNYKNYLLNLKSIKSGDKYGPVKFTMQIDHDNAHKDDKLGNWSNSTHIIPIQAEYSFGANGDIVPGMLTSGISMSETNLNEILCEQQNVNLANLVLTHSASLKSDVDARKIDLPKD